MNERHDDLARQCYKTHTSYFDGRGNITETYFDKEKFADLVRANEREACAKDADWCIQNHLEHLIPERIRARSTT